MYTPLSNDNLPVPSYRIQIKNNIERLSSLILKIYSSYPSYVTLGGVIEYRYMIGVLRVRSVSDRSKISYCGYIRL